MVRRFGQFRVRNRVEREDHQNTIWFRHRGNNLYAAAAVDGEVIAASQFYRRHRGGRLGYMNGRTDSKGDNMNALERLVEDRRKSVNISECLRNPLSIPTER